VSIAVIDIGKTTLKALLFDRTGMVLAEHSAPNHACEDGPYRRIDDAAIWRFIIGALKDIARVGAIETIVVTTHGAAGALIDDHGLVLPIMDYEERKVDLIEEDYAAFRPVFSESLSPPINGGLNLGRQLFYQARHHAEAFARATLFLTLPQYWAWRLSGVAVSDETSLGCHTDLWAPAAHQPSSMAKRMGFDRLLPPLRRPFDALGPIRPEVAAETGLPPDAQVLTGIHDSNASLALHLVAREPPFTVVSTGTWIVLLNVGGDLRRLNPAADMMANIDAMGRPVACAKFMGGREFGAIIGDAPPDADEDDLKRFLARDALILPSFTDQGGPYCGHAGRIEGPPIEHPSELAAAASLYCALVTDDQLMRLGAKGPIIIDGNFTRNAIFSGALAAFRPDQPVEIALDLAGTAKGAATLALWPRGFGARTNPIKKPLVSERLLSYRERWRAAVGS
jgi:sugar (pentulose or hexulose) kinase